MAMSARRRSRIKAAYDRIKVVRVENPPRTTLRVLHGKRGLKWAGALAVRDDVERVWWVTGSEHYFSQRHVAQKYREWRLKREVDRIKRVRWV